jgi:hypothetical protein
MLKNFKKLLLFRQFLQKSLIEGGNDQVVSQITDSHKFLGIGHITCDFDH